MFSDDQPARTRSPQLCSTASVHSPLGPIHFATDECDRLCGVSFHGFVDLRHDIVRFHGTPDEWGEGSAPPVAEAITRYFEGEVQGLSRLEIRSCGSDFEHAVWALLREIPAGETSTYGELARRMGVPGAARAIGHANGRNPVAIVIPCHRVIGANGKLVGYGAGLERKRWLLTHEARFTPVLRPIDWSWPSTSRKSRDG
jgi:methylated-DNA-[protein]-cysteine S-methyltransferase